MLKVISFTIKKYKFSFLFYVCTIFIYKAAKNILQNIFSI